MIEIIISVIAVRLLLKIENSITFNPDIELILFLCLAHPAIEAFVLNNCYLRRFFYFNRALEDLRNNKVTISEVSELYHHINF